MAPIIRFFKGYEIRNTARVDIYRANPRISFFQTKKKARVATSLYSS